MNIPRLFRKYFIPTLAGMLGMCAVTAIDGIFVGHGVGSDGIAAINILIPVFMFLMGVGLMVGAGCSVVASIHLAQGRIKAARINITQAMGFVTLTALLISALLLLFPRQAARWLGASNSLAPLVVDYLLWFTPSFVFAIWTTVALFVIRLDGAPRLAMMCSLVTAIVNVILDWLFIFPFGWGIMGAASASAVSTVIGGTMAVVYLFSYARQLRFYPLKMSRKSLRLSMRNLGYQCRIGSSALLNEATMAMLMFVGNLVFMHYLGDNGVGAFGIACYYAPFVFMVGNAVAQSVQPIISYNFGGNNRRRVYEAARIALSTALLCGTAVTGVFVLFPDFLTRLFISLDTPAAQIAVTGFPLFAAGFIFFILNLTVIGYYQSIEQVLPATLFALLRGFFFLIPAFVLLPRLLGTSGIWLAMPLSETATTLSILLLYLLKKRNRPDREI